MKWQFTTTRRFWRKTLTVSSLALFAVSSHLFAQGMITTYAGPQMPVSGSAASTQAIDYPAAAVPDGSGGVYVVSQSQNRVYDVAANGTLTLIAGSTYGFGGDGGPATDAMLASPFGLATDTAGNLYISDFYNQRIRKVSKDGVITTVAGSGTEGTIGDGGPATSAQLSLPSSIAVDAAGNLYIVLADRVRKVGVDGVITTIAGGGNIVPDTGVAATSALITPSAVAVDSASNVYIGAGILMRVGTDGIITRLTKLTATIGFLGSYMCTESGDGGPAVDANVCFLGGIAKDVSGTLYLTDGNYVRTITADGIIHTIAGGGNSMADGVPATSASMNPYNISLDASGNIYLVINPNSVRKIATDGTISTLVANNVYGFSGDGGPATLAKLSPSVDGLTFDRSGNLYIADTSNSRIRLVTPDGTITTIAGNGSSNYTDSVPAVSTGIGSPIDLFVDNAGNLYELDGTYVRKITPDGVIQTVAGCSGICPGLPDTATVAMNASLGMHGPLRIGVDPIGNLYIQARDRVWKVDSTGAISTILTNAMPPFNGSITFQGFVLAPDGSYYLSGSGSGGGQIYKVTSDGAINRFGGLVDFHPEAMALDSQGNLYAVDGSKIREISASGSSVTTLAGGNTVDGFSGDGGSATSAQLNFDRAAEFADVAVDVAGNVYITDQGNSRIRKITPASSAQSFSASAGGVTYSTVGTASGPMTVGYGILQPAAGQTTTPYCVAVFSYTLNGILISETAVPASPLITSGRIYAESNGPVRTGIAIANPGNQDAAVTFYFTGQNGLSINTGSVTIPANEQYAAFLDQAPYDGTSAARTFTFSASTPVAAIALRAFINERGETLMTTLPVAPTSSISTAPIMLPHYAAGAGWTTQVLLVNPTDTTLTGTIAFDAMHTYSVAPRSATKIVSAAWNVLQTGNVTVTPDPGIPAPVVSSVFTLVTNGITVTESGVATTGDATSFRVFAELDASQTLQTGIAIANTTSSSANLQFELLALDGQSTGFTGSSTLAANGHLSVFLNQIPGLENLPATFRGVLHISSDKAISAIGLRLRYNQRGELVLATTPAIADGASDNAGEYVFPQVVSGGGFTTEFILMNSTAASQSTVTLKSQNGSDLPLFAP
ncbi:MAG TPA: hypothetical protein VGK48_03545 [Terriglobia bacterium]|jgi:sugar lactone lactonase YvrE